MGVLCVRGYLSRRSTDFVPSRQGSPRWTNSDEGPFGRGLWQTPYILSLLIILVCLRFGLLLLSVLLSFCSPFCSPFQNGAAHFVPVIRANDEYFCCPSMPLSGSGTFWNRHPIHPVNGINRQPASEKLVGQVFLPVKAVGFPQKTTDRNVCPTK